MKELASKSIGEGTRYMRAVILGTRSFVVLEKNANTEIIVEGNLFEKAHS